MYTTIVHPLQKAYNLSITEYCVLEAIRNGQNLEKTDYWCVYSQQKMSEAFGVSKAWVNTCYKKLEAKELVKRRRNNSRDTGIRVADEWAEWFSPTFDKYLLYLKNNHVELTTGNLGELKKEVVNKVDYLEQRRSTKLTTVVNKVNQSSKQSLPNTNIYPKDTLTKETRNFIPKEKVNKDSLYKRVEVFKNNLGRAPSPSEYKKILAKVALAEGII